MYRISASDKRPKSRLWSLLLSSLPDLSLYVIGSIVNSHGVRRKLCWTTHSWCSTRGPGLGSDRTAKRLTENAISLSHTPNWGCSRSRLKGGAVAYDPRTDRWTSRDRWKVTHHIKNPVQQARSAKYELLKKLKASPHWKARRIRARHGVVLPHSSALPGDLGADMPQRMFCFAEAFEDWFRDWVLDRFGDAPADEGRTREMGPDGLQALEKILANPFQLLTPLGTLLSQDDAALHVLTQQQFHILRAIEAVPRAAISGAAGTGKTVLAVEEARRCAEHGARTLFICYNRGLASDVRHRLKDGPPVRRLRRRSRQADCGSVGLGSLLAGYPFATHPSKCLA